ncbi:hypothetical protein BTE77_34905 [Ensifer adhaerens]|nr:hypothetical protein BTE77_34905 [Ensifer adhaerens]
MTNRATRRRDAAVTARLNTLKADYERAIIAKDFERALAFTRQASAIAPIPAVLTDQALCLLRLERNQEAYELYRRLAQNLSSESVFDGLTEACGRLGKSEEAAAYGTLALAHKDRAVNKLPRQVLPAVSPPHFEAGTPDRNIIAFTLYGASPRYCETAVLNVAAARELLPGWSCRFYCDDSVPRDVIRRLHGAGARVVFPPAEIRSAIHPTMWRFLIADDPSVSRFLVRDADSLIGVREKTAVDAWLASDRWFHVMRDYYTHTELILAGLWGGCGGVFDDMAAAMVDFINRGDYKSSHLDQHFLRAAVWPTIRQSVLSHDSQFAFFNNEPFPEHAPPASTPEQHVGANVGAPSIAVACPHPDGTRVEWSLVDAASAIVCQYSATVARATFSTHLPRAYVDAISAGLWKIHWTIATAGQRQRDDVEG